MSIAITALLLVTVAALFLYGVKADREGTFFMSKDFTTTMKGLAAIVVVFVHFPTEYQNKLQDLVGSFAYVAVTVFSCSRPTACCSAWTETSGTSKLSG